MAKEVYAKGNYLYIDDELGIIRRFPKAHCDFGKDATNWKITNRRTKEVFTIPIADVATWFDEPGTTAYTEATLDTLLEGNTGN